MRTGIFSIAFALLITGAHGQEATQTPQPSPVPVAAQAVASPSPSPSPTPNGNKIEINVVGAVAHAGRFSLPKEAGVVGAISAAGWFAEAGDQKKVKVLRKNGEKAQVFFVNILQILTGDQPDIILQPEDTIYVTQKMVNF